MEYSVNRMPTLTGDLERRRAGEAERLLGGEADTRLSSGDRERSCLATRGLPPLSLMMCCMKTGAPAGVMQLQVEGLEKLCRWGDSLQLQKIKTSRDRRDA